MNERFNNVENLSQGFYEFPFFYQTDSLKFRSAYLQILNQSPTLSRYLLTAQQDTVDHINKLIQTGLMFGSGFDGLEGSKVSITHFIYQTDRETAKKIGSDSEFKLRKSIEEYDYQLTSFTAQEPIADGETLLALGHETIAQIATINPLIEKEKALEVSTGLFDLVKILKSQLKTVYEDPSNQLSIIASINDLVNALRDISLHLQYPHFFKKITDFITGLTGVQLIDLYNTEAATQTIKRMLNSVFTSKKDQRVLHDQAHIVGAFKPVTSQLYGALFGRNHRFNGDGSLIPLSREFYQDVAEAWEAGNQRIEIEENIFNGLQKIDDRVRCQIYLPDFQSFNTLAFRFFGFLNLINMQKFSSIIRKFPKAMRDILRAEIFVSEYPQRGQVKASTYRIDSDPARQIEAILRKNLEQGTICYCGLHTYVLASVKIQNKQNARQFAAVPLEISLRLGQGPLRALYRAGTTLRKHLGEGGQVPNYHDFFLESYPNIFKKALEELDTMD